MAEKKTAAKPSAKAVKTTTASKVKKADQEKETAAVNEKELTAKATDKKTDTADKKSTAAKKTAAKKTTAKKTTAKKETVTKASSSKTAATSKSVKETKKTTAKKTTNKATAKKPAAAKSTNSAKTSAPKTTSKKAKLEQYQSHSMDTCIAMMQAMGVRYAYDDYAALLMNEADLKKIEEKIINDFKLTKEAFHYDDDGYDLDLVPVVLEKIAETIDFKASDYPQMEKDVADAVTYIIAGDTEKNGEEYLLEFHLWERLLMIAQRQGYRSEEELGTVIKADLHAFLSHFLQLARSVLANWQYDDVKYFENFAYAVLPQFTDLFADYNNELMMDVADLYILHEDYGQGDADYGYLIRENQIKDYVYYRFAHVYEDIDLDKAKSIAYDALQYVDGRYDYYQPIIDILNR